MESLHMLLVLVLLGDKVETEETCDFDTGTNVIASKED